MDLEHCGDSELNEYVKKRKVQGSLILNQEQLTVKLKTKMHRLAKKIHAFVE